MTSEARIIERGWPFSGSVTPVVARLILPVVVSFILTGLPVVTAAVPPQGPVASAMLRGTVRDARTGEPIPRAQVTLTDATSTSSDPPTIAQSITGPRGAFALGGLEAGIYRVTVMSNGFAREESRVVIGAGEIVDDLVVPIAPAGAISGRVYSSTGRPLVGARVSLQRLSYTSNGAQRMSTVASAQTNDLGEYRLYWVSPGRYYVMAEGNNGSIFVPDPRSDFLNSVRRGSNEVRDTGAPRYYPGVPDVSAASMIEIREEADLGGIDFVLPPQRLHSIRGRLIDPLTGEPPEQASISLSQTGSSGSSVSWYDRTTGMFEIPNLDPGAYGVTATIDEPTFGNFLGTSPSGRRAAAVILVDEADVENIEMEIREQPVISGQALIDGPIPEDFSPDRLRIRLVPADPGAGYAALGGPSARVDPDATFTLPTSRFGEFRVTISGLPEGFYLKEARLDGRDVLNAASPFSFAGSLGVVVSAGAGRVVGRVLDGEGRGAVAVAAVLIPDLHRNRTELYRRAETDDDGRYSLAGVPPGDYKLFAWEHVEGNAFYDDRTLQPFEALGTPVRVEEASELSVELGLIPGEIAP